MSVAEVFGIPRARTGPPTSVIPGFLDSWLLDEYSLECEFSRHQWRPCSVPGYTWRTADVFSGVAGGRWWFIHLYPSIALLSSVKLAASAPLIGRQGSGRSTLSLSLRQLNLRSLRGTSMCRNSLQQEHSLMCSVCLELMELIQHCIWVVVLFLWEETTSQLLGGGESEIY